MKKRYVSVILILSLVIMVFTCACGTSEAKSAYKPPAEIFGVTISGTSEPVIDGVRFTYDSKARIDTVTFTYDGYDYTQQYSYDNPEQIVIKTIYQTEVVEEKVIRYVDIPVESGFTTVDGYYINVTDDISESISAASNGDHTSEQDKQTESSVDWKKLYRDYLEEFMSRDDLHISKFKDNLVYALVYIDEDDIPELYITGTFHVARAGSVLCWINNGVVLEEDCIDSIRYIEKSGQILSHGGWTGLDYYTIYRLETDSLITVAHGRADIPLNRYVWNDVEISESEFYNKPSEYFDDTKAKSASEATFSYEQIWDQLS